MKKIALFVFAAALIFGATTVQTKAYFGIDVGFGFGNNYGYNDYSNQGYGSGYGSGYDNYGYGNNNYNSGYGYGGGNYSNYNNSQYGGYGSNCGYGCGGGYGGGFGGNYGGGYGYPQVTPTPPSYYYQTVTYPWMHTQQSSSCQYRWYIQC